MTGPEPGDLELLRRLYAKWSAGDFDNTELFAEDVVWVANVFDGGEYHGFEEMTASWKEFLGNFSRGFRIEAEEIVAGSDGRYVVRQVFHGTGRTSGVETESRTALVLAIRDGRIARMEGFWDWDEALAAAGLKD